MRFAFFFGFLYYLISGTKTLAGYETNQAIFFFLTFNLIDVLSQFLYREVYRFRPLVVSGDFDLVLLKPFNALFRVLMGGADVIDLITIPPLIFAALYIGRLLNPSLTHVLLFIILILNGLIIATAFHIAVLAFGIMSLEIDHTIMIYRDILSLGRFPLDIYKEPVRSIITYLIPVGVMITLPAKSLMGLVSLEGILYSFLLGALSIILSLKFWGWAIKRYTSASS